MVCHTIFSIKLTADQFEEDKILQQLEHFPESYSKAMKQRFNRSW